MNDSTKDFEPAPASSDSFSSVLETGSRVVATFLGIVVILVGLWSALKVFGALYQGLTGPQGFAKTFDGWAKVVGGEKLNLTVNGITIPLAPVLAVIVLGGGAFLLTWLAMGIMLTGAKIISWTSGDREAVKRILEHSLGKSRR